LCRFTAPGLFILSSSFNVTSESTPRIVVVIGAMVTVDKYSIAVPCKHHDEPLLVRCSEPTEDLFQGPLELFS